MACVDIPAWFFSHQRFFIKGAEFGPVYYTWNSMKAGVTLYPEGVKHTLGHGGES
jgi:hypothetical protein